MKTDPLLPSHQLIMLAAQSQLTETIPHLTAADGHQSFLPKQPLNYTNRNIKIVNKLSFSPSEREKDRDHLSLGYKRAVPCLASQAAPSHLQHAWPQTSSTSSRESPVSYSSLPSTPIAESSGRFAVPNAS